MRRRERLADESKRLTSLAPSGDGSSTPLAMTGARRQIALFRLAEHRDEEDDGHDRRVLGMFGRDLQGGRHVDPGRAAAQDPLLASQPVRGLEGIVFVLAEAAVNHPVARLPAAPARVKTSAGRGRGGA